MMRLRTTSAYTKYKFIAPQNLAVRLLYNERHNREIKRLERGNKSNVIYISRCGRNLEIEPAGCALHFTCCTNFTSPPLSLSLPSSVLFVLCYVFLFFKEDGKWS